jgi:lipopolysaccharide transport system ATP-binding protein
MIKAYNISKMFKIYANPWHRGLEWATLGKTDLHKEFWALRDVSFHLNRGECLGIIGPNGAGKSTLLKILTRALYPTSGSFEIQGRVLSLLELGTGFNNELTGRQNLYNSVNLLGFPEEYLENRIIDIEAFAELGDFFDLPIKLYSTGMYVRLAFSLFVFLQPDVLIIDETLSVGDVFFQQKSFAKLREIISVGTTCLFVSHDTVALQSLCRQAILLEHGEIAFIGDAKEAVSRYYGSPSSKRSIVSNGKQKMATPETLTNKIMNPLEIRVNNILAIQKNHHGRGGLEIVAARITNEENHDTMQTKMMGTLLFHLLIRAQEKIIDPSVGIHLFDRLGNIVFAAGTRQLSLVLPDLSAGDEIVVKMALKLNVQPGEYTFSLGASEPSADGNPNVGIIQDRYELLGPLVVYADQQKLMPFYGIAQLPMQIEYSFFAKKNSHVQKKYVNIKPGLESLIRKMHFEEVKKCWCGGLLQPWQNGFEDYVKCATCGCKSVKVRPTQKSLNDFYKSNYWYDYQTIHGCPTIQERYESDMSDRIPQYLNWICQMCSEPAKVLEVGCGNGRLSHELAKAGYVVCASEMDPNIAMWVTTKTGVPVFASDFPPIEQGSYDLIIIVDVLEHIYDPISFVNEIKSRLRLDGQVFLHCPVIDTDAEAQSLNNLFNPLSHIRMHTTTSMFKLWQSVNLKPVKIGELFSMPCFAITCDE